MVAAAHNKCKYYEAKTTTPCINKTLRSFFVVVAFISNFLFQLELLADYALTVYLFISYSFLYVFLIVNSIVNKFFFFEATIMSLAQFFDTLHFENSLLNFKIYVKIE